ncbi:hypothetical protein ABPG75_007114 [Micractinium tetrahymenae]
MLASARGQRLGAAPAPGRSLAVVPRRLIAARAPGAAQQRRQQAPQPPAAQQQSGGGMYPPIYQSPLETGGKLSERQEDMLRVGTALRNIGWLSFWGQLVLTVVSTIILLFSAGTVAGTSASFTVMDIANLFGIVCGYISTFLAWSYTRAGRKLGLLQEVKLPSIAGTVIANSNLNLLGMGATIISLQAIVGSLVAKTLSSASAAGIYGAQRVAPPPVAFDVFSVQACTNTIMAHFAGMLFSNWILLVVNKYLKRQAERDAAFAADTAPSAPPMPGAMY